MNLVENEVATHGRINIFSPCDARLIILSSSHPPSFFFLFFFSRKNQLVVPNCTRDIFKLFLPNVIYEFFNACFISNPRHFFSHSFVNFEEPVEPSKKKSFFLIARWKLYFFFYNRAICFRIIFIISIVWFFTRLVDDTINIKFCKITILIQK